MKVFKNIGIITLSLVIILGLNSSVVEATIYISNNVEYRSGLRLDLDGVDEAGKSGNDPTGNTDTAGTVSFWVVFDTVLAANGALIVIGMGGDDTDQASNFGRVFVSLRYVAASSIFNRIEMFHSADGSATANRIVGNTVISADTLYHVVASSSGTAWKIYVNGTLQTLTTITGSNNGDWWGDIGTVGTRHYSLGSNWRDGAWGAGYVNGKIDDVAMWSSQLSDTEVTTLYNNGKPTHPCAVGLCTNLNNYWRLGEDESETVTTMYDTVGTGTVDNFTMENMENADIVRTSYY